MKNVALILIFLFETFFGWSQNLQISFNQYLSFNLNYIEYDFFKIIKNDSIVLNEVLFGQNDYIIDLDNKTIDFTSEASGSSSAEIDSVEERDGFMFIKIKDRDLITNETIWVYFAINKEVQKNEYPYFTFYYESAGSMWGYIVVLPN